MLDTATKKRIDDCRDILVGKLPDPKAQIEQITIGLIYKFMDDMDKEAIELGGKAKFFSDYTIPDPENPKKKKRVPFTQYSWDNLFNAKITATEMLRLYSEAIAGMDKNPNIPQLFRDIFKNAYLPYRDPETLKMFLKTISGFEYTHSEKLGDAFEYLLSVMGSQGDAGQFRTPRHIIDFVVAAVNPGKTDTILDPACGTAGFLIAAFKYIMNARHPRRDKACLVSATETGLVSATTFTPDEQKKLIQNFVGYDISPDMVRLSLVNLYLHGFSDPHIWEYDTLSSEDRWDETYDVILANPPFMSPKGGIRPHKKFSISSNRSEVLFVDYIAEHLNPKGRAGIIVPEGVIFQSGKAYKDLRKMLVENYLYAVVSLPAGVFNPYSGVKTSVLLMDKQFAKKSNEILFVKIDNDGYGLGAQRNAIKGGQLEEAIQIIHDFVSVETRHALSPDIYALSPINNNIAHTVPKKEIAKYGDYNLSGERYKILVKDNSEHQIVELGAVAKLYQPQTISQKEMKEDGKYLVYGANGIIGRYNLYNHEDKEVLITCRGATCGTINMSTPKTWITGNAMVAQPLNPNKLSKEYLFYILKNSDLSPTISGSAQPQITRQGLSPYKIPLPPLSIQEEIVAEIECYQQIINGAKAVVENYKPKIDIDPDWEMVELGELFSKSTKGIIPPDLKVKTINYIGLDNISQGTGELVGEYNADPQVIKSLKTLFGRTNILYGKLRPNLNKVYYAEIEGICSTDIFVLVGNENVEAKFYAKYFLSEKFNNEVLKGLKGAQLPRVGYEYFSKIIIPVPPLQTQRQIVAQIEKEQALVNANKQLIEIFEQKIKDRIAKVWGVEKSHPKVYEEDEELTMAAEG